MAAMISKRAAVLALMICLSAPIAMGGAHTWDVNELFSNADGTIQFIELKNTDTPGETGMVGQTISSSLASLVPGGSITGPTNLKHYLIATQSFADLPGAPTPDRIINPLTPGEAIPFFDINGDSVSFAAFDTLTFGSGVLPTDGILSLDRNLNTAVNSPTNYSDVGGTVDASSAPVPLAFGWMSVLLVALLTLVGIGSGVRLGTARVK